MIINNKFDINTSRVTLELKPFPIVRLLKLCQDQNTLQAEVDDQIGRFIQQLSGYEQELYEKDVYIRKLEGELKREGKII